MVRSAAAFGLSAYPAVSLLSHPECAPAHRAYLDRCFGLRLWEPGVYTFIGQILDSAINAFSAGTNHPRFFHARMDEAQAALRANSLKLHKPPADVLAEHIRKVRRLLAGHRCRLVVYHDMLLSRSEINIAPAHGAPPLGTAAALDKIPRDVVINFWLYDFLPGHEKAVEHFLRRGFDVWLSPWQAPEAGMAQVARRRNLPLLWTTWVGAGDVHRYCTLLRAMARAAAEIRGQPVPGTPQAILRAALAICGPASAPELAMIASADLPAGAIAAGPLSELAKRLPDQGPAAAAKANLLRGKFVLFDAPLSVSLPERLATAPRPLYLLHGGQRAKISRVDAPRGEGQVVLYTDKYGTSTHTNIFGGEMAVVNGVVEDHTIDWYGAGDFPIPPGGCVVSAHWAGRNPNFFGRIRLGNTVRIVDAAGRDLLPPKPLQQPLQERAVTIPLPRLAAGSVLLLHGTVRASNRGAALGTVDLALRDGRDVAHKIVYGRDVGPFSYPLCLDLPVSPDAPRSWIAWAEASPQPLILWATLLPASQPLRVAIVPTQAGLRAGWCILAVALASAE